MDMRKEQRFFSLDRIKVLVLITERACNNYVLTQLSVYIFYYDTIFIYWYWVSTRRQ